VRYETDIVQKIGKMCFNFGKIDALFAELEEAIIA